VGAATLRITVRGGLGGTTDGTGVGLVSADFCTDSESAGRLGEGTDGSKLEGTGRRGSALQGGATSPSLL
jgi:hypothetical protein